VEAWDFLRERGSVEAWGARSVLLAGESILIPSFPSFSRSLRFRSFDLPFSPFSLHPFGMTVKDFQSYSPDVPFCVSKAMLLRAKRYAFGVRKGTF